MREGKTVTPERRPAILNELLNKMPQLDEPACAKTTMDPDIWFPESKPEWIAARTMLAPICGACPALTDCLEFALENYIFEGYWAGTTPTDRRKIMSARGAKNKETRIAQLKLNEVRRLLAMGMTQERACSEVGIDTGTFKRYEYREANEWDKIQHDKDNS